MAPVAALYNAGSSTEHQPRQQGNTPAQQALVASLWQAELAKSMADIECRRRKALSQ